MPAQATTFSPAELSYLHTSLSLSPPIRPDGRGPRQFRPVVAEVDILPSTNGSARICLADGTEAVVGVKAETAGVEQSGTAVRPSIEVSVDIPSFRDDDPLPVFLSSMIRESLLPGFPPLTINSRWYWRLYIDIFLLSPPLSYPLPLLSMTTHLALRATRIPRLVSEGDEDPLFDDDWAASVLLYTGRKPPVTLLVGIFSENAIFDPTIEELSVAEAVFAVSVAPTERKISLKGADTHSEGLQIVSMRSVNPPSRITAAAEGTGASSSTETSGHQSTLWSPPLGGVKRQTLKQVSGLILGNAALGHKGVANEILEGLENIEGLT